MARSKMFDNIMHVIKSSHTSIVSGSGTVSDELDLELPRGYVAKIKEIVFEAVNGEALVHNIQGAVVNDPDDNVTITIPENRVDHDVIADVGYQQGAGSTIGSWWRQYYFDQELDVIAARNIRVNLANSGAGAFNMMTKIYYTLEEVTSDLLLNLLDIL